MRNKEAMERARDIKKMGTRKRVNIYVDTEYAFKTKETDGVIIQNTVPISLQALLELPNGEEYKLLFLNRDFVPQQTSNTICLEARRQGINCIILSFSSRTPIDLIWDVYLRGLEDHLIKIHYFFAPADILFLFGEDTITDLLNANKLDEKRALHTEFSISTNPYSPKLNFEVYDMSGLYNGSLKALAELCGVEAGSKDTFSKEEKSNMLQTIQQKPLDFLYYSMEDVFLLKDIMQKYVDLLNEIRSKLGLPAIKDIPNTVGAIVSQIIADYIDKVGYDKFKDDWFIIKNLLSYPFLHDEVIKIDYYERMKEAAHLYKVGNKAEAKKKIQETRNKYSHYPIVSLTNTTSFKSLCHTNNTALLAPTQGGRCNNNMPQFMKYKNVCDIDISGCYGQALRDFDLVVGIPLIIRPFREDGYFNFKEAIEFVQKHSEPHQWVMAVQCDDLSFDQDLIISRDFTYTTVVKSIVFPEEVEDDIEVSHINAPSCVARREILNGIITQDILDVLLSVATNREKSEIYKKFKVLAIALFPKEWTDNPLNKDVLKIRLSKYCEGIPARKLRGAEKEIKKISPPNFKVPLENIVGQLYDWRMSIKKDPNNQALQKMLKLIINTVYGVLASPYFMVGSSIVANNITARARAYVWVLEKALATRQTITDGGHFQYTRIVDWSAYKKSSYRVGNKVIEAKKPGLNTLANLYTLYTKDNKFPTTSLAEYAHDKSFLEKKCYEHILEFCSLYDLNFPYRVEIKDIFDVAVYFGKAHYTFYNHNKETGYLCVATRKMRGFKEYENIVGRGSLLSGRPPHFDLFDAIARDKTEDIPEILSRKYAHRYIVKFKTLKYWLTLKDDTTLKKVALNSRPGDTVIVSREFILKRQHVFVDTMKRYKYLLTNSQKASNNKMLLKPLLDGRIREFLDKLNQEKLK